MLRRLSRLNRRPLSCFNRTSVLSQQISFAGRAEICPLPTIRIVEASEQGSGRKDNQNGPKWIESGRHDPRIGPNESYGQKSDKKLKKCLFGVSRRGHFSSSTVSFCLVQHTKDLGCPNGADCYLRQGDGGTKTAHFGSRSCLLR